MMGRAYLPFWKGFKPNDPNRKVPHMRLTQTRLCEGGEPRDTEIGHAWFGGGRLETQVMLCAGRLPYGVHHVTDPEQQRRDRLKDSICQKAGLPLYRVSGRPSVRTIRRLAEPQAKDRTSLRARRLAGVLGAGLGNGLGLVLWWQAGQYVQPGVSQLCWWPLVVAAIGPLLSYLTLMLVKGRHVVSAIRVLPMQLLNGMLFFFTVLLLTIGFYLGWTDGGGVTLLGASLFLPYVFLAPLVIGTYLTRDAPGSVR